MKNPEEFKSALRDLLREYGVVMAIDDCQDEPALINFYGVDMKRGEVWIDWYTRKETGEE